MLETMVATGLDAQGAGTVVALGVAVIQGFIGRLQPDLVAGRVLRGGTSSSARASTCACVSSQVSPL